MIESPDHGGVIFSEASDGDMKQPFDRARLSAAAGIEAEWGLLTQVHGTRVVRASGPGIQGEADAIWTTTRDLPIAVLTADCYGVVMGSDAAVGVAHAGWRGVASGVISSLRDSMEEGGHAPSWAASGPGIGVCCFEVGPDVAGMFPDSVGTTDWGTRSVDLLHALEEQLDGLEHAAIRECTYSDEGWFSHRKDSTKRRLASIGWVS